MRLHASFGGLILMVAYLAAFQDVAHGVQDPISGDIRTVQEAMRTGHLREARMKLAALTQEQPGNAEISLQLGLLLGQLGATSEATTAFRQAIHTRPDWPEAHLNLGLSLIANRDGQRDWLAATTEFQEAVRLRPDYYEAHRLLGSALLEQGKNEQAIAEFRRALKGQKNAAEIHLDLGRASEASGNPTEAETEYRAALRIRPDYADARIALGKLISTRSPDEALLHVRRALAANPDSGAAQYALARLLQRQGAAAEAQAAFREAAALAKRQQDAVRCTRLSNEGLDAAHHGDGELAIRKLREAVELRPDAAIVHFNFGLVLADHGDLTKGQAEVTKAISLSPAEAHFYLVLGRMLARRGQSTKARAAFDRAVRLDPGNNGAKRELQQLDKPTGGEEQLSPFEFGAEADTADAHFAFAAFLSSGQDWVGASGEWMRVLALQPGQVDARNNLGVSLVHAGHSDAAELEFYKSLQVLPDSAGAHFGLAIVNLERGDKARAREELQAVLRVQPEYPKAQSLLGEISTRAR